MEFSPSLLEEWMRAHYFAAEADIGSSGVADLNLDDLRALTGVTTTDLDSVVLRDSPCTGRADLRAAIARRWGNGDPDWVTTTHGASEAIFVALTTLIEPGDEVVALSPAYHTHTSVADSIGCAVRLWELRANDHFAPDLDKLATLVTPRTKAVVVNFPHNPTGVTLTPRQQCRLIEIVANVDAYLVWDGAFTELTHVGDPLPDPTQFYSKTISVGTFSKAFGLPGMRFGWCAAQPKVIRGMVLLRDRITLSLSPLLELVALRVVENADRVIGPRLELARSNRATLTEWATTHADLVDYFPPPGGVTAFPALRGIPDTRPVCAALAAEDQVLLVPGAAFGYPGHVRLGFGGPAEGLATGLTALTRQLRLRRAKKQREQPC